MSGCNFEPLSWLRPFLVSACNFLLCYSSWKWTWMFTHARNFSLGLEKNIPLCILVIFMILNCKLVSNDAWGSLVLWFMISLLFLSGVCFCCCCTLSKKKILSFFLSLLQWSPGRALHRNIIQLIPSQVYIHKWGLNDLN